MALVDPYGQPIQAAQLKESQTAKLTALKREIAEHPARGLTPAQLNNILAEAEGGDLTAQHQLFTDMEERDGHIFAEMSKRKRALLTLSWDVAPPRNASASEKKLADYAREVLRDMTFFNDALLDMLDGVGHGFSALEIDWASLGSERVPSALHHREQSWFQLDKETRTQLRLRDGSDAGQELWPFAWVIHRHKAKSGVLSRSGLYRVLVWPFLFKCYSVGDLAEFLEIHGLPLRLGKFPQNATDAEKVTLLEAVLRIGHDAAGIIPREMEIDFKEAVKASHDPFMAMVDWSERTVSKAILGGTLTSQSDGKSSTNALGNVHNEVRHDLLVADAAQIEDTITRDLIYSILALNKGFQDIRRCPRLKFDTVQPEDIKTFADALPKLTRVMRIPASWAHEKLRIPQPAEGDEVLGTKPVPGTPSPNPQAATAVAALTSEFPDQTMLDTAADAAESELQGWSEEFAASALTALEEAGSFEAALALLEAAEPAAGAGALAERLNRAMFTAGMVGMLGAQSETADG